MAVISSPKNGRVRFTYPGNLTDQRINGINPTALPMHVMSLVNAIQAIQSANISEAFYVVENELRED